MLSEVNRINKDNTKCFLSCMIHSYKSSDVRIKPGDTTETLKLKGTTRGWGRNSR